MTLITCAQVCKNWREAAYNPHCWKGYTLHVHEKSLLAKVSSARSVKERGIKEVSITNMKKHQNVTARMLKNIASHADISAMTLKDLYLLPEVAIDIPKQFDSLRVLAIKHRCISEEGLRIALQPMVNLEELFLRWWTQDLWGKGISMAPCYPEFDYMGVIIDNLPKLRDLEIIDDAVCLEAPNLPVSNKSKPDLQRLVFNGMLNMVGAMADIPRAFPNLRHFELRCTSRGHSNDYLQDSLFSSLCTELQSLVLYDAKFMPTHVTTILHCSNLQALDLTLLDIVEQDSLGDYELGSLCVSLPNLKLLNLSGHNEVTSRALNRIPGWLKKLEVLKLPDVFRSFHEINEFLNLVENLLKNLISLRYPLYIGREVMEIRCIKYISDYDEKEILKRCIIDHKQFISVRRDSKEWHEAVGAKFFLLPTTHHLGRMYD